MRSRELGYSGTAHASETPAALSKGSPAVILVHPQLGQNIGMAARAMFNFALTDLRLVKPRDGWPSEWAEKASAGALEVIENAQVFETVEEAVADLHYVFATTARERDQLKTVVTPEEAARKVRAGSAEGQKFGFLFGPERSGLANEHIALANEILMVPLNPGFSSLNLSQAVLLMGYEWFKLADQTPASRVDLTEHRLATREEMVNMFEHLESELDQSGFLRPVEKRAGMILNLRNIFQRAPFYDQDVRTMRGIIKALALYGRGRIPDEDEL